MKVKHGIAAACAALVLSLSGCGSDDDSPTVGKEIADDYNQAMDDAAAVEDQLQEQKEKLDQALEEAEGDNGDP